MMDYLKNETFETLSSVPMFERFLKNEIARSTYCIGDMEIYKTDRGVFYYLPILAENQKQHVHMGDIETVERLHPIPMETHELIAILEEENERLHPWEFHLISIEYIQNKPTFVVFHHPSRCYLRLEHQSFKDISSLTSKALEGLDKSCTFGTPLPLLLNEEGALVRVGEQGAQ